MSQSVVVTNTELISAYLSIYLLSHYMSFTYVKPRWIFALHAIDWLPWNPMMCSIVIVCVLG